MNRSSFLIPLLLMGAITSPCFALDEIPMVGLDDAGTPVTYVKSKNEYVTELKAMASAVDDSILPSLESKSTKWMLRTVVVGLGLGVEVGVGPVIKLKASPRFRLVYANSKDPVVP